jgi:hypothetical protein
MAKSAPWFVHYGCVPGLYPDLASLLTASMLKPTQTPFIAGPLALIVNVLHIRTYISPHQNHYLFYFN